MQPMALHHLNQILAHAKQEEIAQEK